MFRVDGYSRMYSSIRFCRMYVEKGERNKVGESIFVKKGKFKIVVFELKF